MGLESDGVIGSLYDALGHPQPAGGNHANVALETTSSLAQPSRLAGLLRSLGHDGGAVANCASQSYLHPLGFHKLMLINAAPLFELRLHVWWPDSSPGADHIHNHRFPFASAIVRGGYKMQIFQAAATGVPMLEYREQPSPDGGWQLTAVSPAHLTPVASLNLAPGTSYAVAADTLHRVTVAPGSLCVTLLLSTAYAAGPTTRVFAEPGQPVRGLIPLTTMSCDDYRGHLTVLIDELTRQG
jgi:hypothetical protein